MIGWITATPDMWVPTQWARQPAWRPGVCHGPCGLGSFEVTRNSMTPSRASARLSHARAGAAIRRQGPPGTPGRIRAGTRFREPLLRFPVIR